MGQDLAFRDLQMGSIAKEMQEQDIFGHEMEVSAIYTGTDELQALLFDGEVQAYEQMYALLMKGQPVEGPVTYTAHVFGAEGDEACRQRCLELLEEREPAFREKLAVLGKTDDSGNEEAIANLVAAIDDPTQHTSRALYAFARQGGSVTEEEFARLTDKVPHMRDATGRFAGFAFERNGAVDAYVSGFLPAAWRKWAELKEAGTAVSPITRGAETMAIGKSSAQRREEFTTQLKATYTLEWLRSAAALL